MSEKLFANFKEIDYNKFNILNNLFFDLSEPVFNIFNIRMKRYIKNMTIRVTEVNSEELVITAIITWRHKKTQYVHELTHEIIIKYNDIPISCKTISTCYQMIALELYYIINLLQNTKCKVHCSKCIKKECSRGKIIERYVHKFNKNR